MIMALLEQKNITQSISMKENLPIKIFDTVLDSYAELLRFDINGN